MKYGDELLLRLLFRSEYLFTDLLEMRCPRGVVSKVKLVLRSPDYGHQMTGNSLETPIGVRYIYSLHWRPQAHDQLYTHRTDIGKVSAISVKFKENYQSLIIFGLWSWNKTPTNLLGEGEGRIATWASKSLTFISISGRQETTLVVVILGLNVLGLRPPTSRLAFYL